MREKCHLIVLSDNLAVTAYHKYLQLWDLELKLLSRQVFFLLFVKKLH